MNEDESRNPASLPERLQVASSLADEGDWGGAFMVLQDAEREAPDDATLLCMLGVAAEETDAAGLAYDYFRRALGCSPTDPELLVVLGTALARYDDPDAEGALRLAALSAPGSKAARLEYGAYLAREGIYDVAIEELEHARSLDPDDPRISREAAVVYMLVGETARTAEELEKAFAASDDDAETGLLLGLALLLAGREEEGAEAIHRAAVEMPGDGDAQLLCAAACAVQEWWDEAWEALARADLAEAQPQGELSREVEEVLEAGAGAALDLLMDQLAPSALRERLLARH